MLQSFEPNRHILVKGFCWLWLLTEFMKNVCGLEGVLAKSIEIGPCVLFHSMRIAQASLLHLLMSIPVAL